MKDFTELDKAILARIAESRCTFMSIVSAVIEIAEPLAGGAGGFRVVDRRLQSMRKRGLIYFNKSKWFINATASTRTNNR